MNYGGVNKEGSIMIKNEDAVLIEKIIKTIASIPKEELPRIYDELNDGRCPKEFDECLKNNPIELIVFLLNEIKWEVGFKAIWRYKKLQEEHLTEQQFEDWWESNFIYEPLNKLYERFGEEDSSKQSKKGKNCIKNVSYFLLGSIFTVFLFFLKFICT